MSSHSSLDSIERQLRVHDLRLVRLRAWRKAVAAALSRCEAERRCGKPVDGTANRETLVYERDTLDREIGAHETLIALGRDRQVLELLDAVAGDAALAREAAPDPRAFAASRGVQLPRNMAVKVKVDAGRVTVQVDYVDRGGAASFTFERAR